VLLTQSGTSAGLVGRFSGMKGSQAGDFDGYVFDVSTSGAWKLVDDNETSSDVHTLASGTTTALGTGTWHRLSLSLNGSTISASVDGNQVTSVTNSTWTKGPAGVEAGAFTHDWPRAQYSNLLITQ
jgi:hypothetical protein